jgi:alpha-beta hydrolase superfamily lysophospholipase
MGTKRRAGLAAAAAAAPFGLAYRFALAYRARAGYPRRYPPLVEPSVLGLPFEETTIRSGELDLPGWFIPANDGAPGPGVVLVHGWESARDRTLPNIEFLHAAGFHCLTFDVRGHGANAAEILPISGGEFGLDALAGFEALIARPEVTRGAILGHSMGGIGSILAAAADPRVAAIVATSSPADPYRLTRQTFRIAHLPIPDPIAYPLAWLTTRVYLRPRGHLVAEISATRAIARYAGPVLLVHGALDQVVPVGHVRRLETAAREARAGDAAAAPVEALVVEGGHHSWLYEFEEYRRSVASFLARTLVGPLDPEAAGDAAAAVLAERLRETEIPFRTVVPGGGGIRTLVRVALPGATQPDPTLAGPLDESDPPEIADGSLPAAEPDPNPPGSVDARPRALRPIDP